MANAAYWFKHDSNAKDDHKIMLLMDQLGLEGYGIYWVLIETLREQEGYRYPIAMLPILAKRYTTSSEKMRAVVLNYGLFDVYEDELFASPSLLRRMAGYEAIAEKRRIAGSEGGKKKAKNVANAKQMLSKSQANAKQDCSKPVASRVDKSRVEEIREEEEKTPKSEPSGRSLPKTFLESPFREEAYKFADWFSTEWRPEEVPFQRDDWAQVYDRLRRKDGYTKQQIKNAVKFGRTDPFWSKNFRSPLKLRNKNQDGEAYISIFLRGSEENGPGQDAAYEYKPLN